MSELENKLRASILFVQMRERVEALTAQLAAVKAQLAAVIHENDLLRETNRIMELRLQRLTLPRKIVG